MLNKSKNLESASDWSDWGENSGTFSLKMGKTPHPTCPPDVGGVGGATPCHQEKLFQQTLSIVLRDQF
jgi:hypothetical protein